MTLSSGLYRFLEIRVLLLAHPQLWDRPVRLSDKRHMGGQLSKPPRVFSQGAAVEIHDEGRSLLSGPRSGIDGHARGSETPRQALASENQVEPGGAFRICLAVTVSATWLLLGVGMCFAVQINKSEIQKLFQRILIFLPVQAHTGTISPEFDVEVAAQQAVPVGVIPVVDVVPQPVQPLDLRSITSCLRFRPSGLNGA